MIGEIMFLDEFMKMLAVFGAMNLVAGLGMLIVIDAKVAVLRALLAPFAGMAARIAAGKTIAAIAAANLPDETGRR
jgi:hypothetical protein